MSDVFTGGHVHVLLFCYLDLRVDTLKVKVTQSCLTLCDPTDYTVHGILQARVLEWVSFPFPGDIPNPGIEPRSSALQADSLVQFSSVAQSCPALCHPMDTGLPVLHYQRELTQTHVHWVGDAIQPSHPLLLLLLPTSIFPSIRVFSNESVLRIRWPKDWGFGFIISPSNEYSGLISFRMDWLDVLAVQGTPNVF